MPLEVRRQRNGSLRPNWYARYEVNGQRFTVNLNIKIKGTPPESLTQQGDTEFECSRAIAQAKLNDIVEEVRSKRDATHLMERIYESKTDEVIKGVKLQDLPGEWIKIPRRSKPCATYAEQSKRTLERFTGFMAEKYPKVREIAQVTRAMATAFMESFDLQERTRIGAMNLIVSSASLSSRSMTAMTFDALARVARWGDWFRSATRVSLGEL